MRKLAFEAPKVLIREIVVILEKKISRVRQVSQLDVPDGGLGDRALELANINRALLNHKSGEHRALEFDRVFARFKELTNIRLNSLNESSFATSGGYLIELADLHQSE